jgi:hypothetical protein
MNNKRYPRVNSSLSKEMEAKGGLAKADFDFNCRIAYSNGYHDCIVDLCHERDKLRQRLYSKKKYAEYAKDTVEMLTLEHNKTELMDSINRIISALRGKNV